MINCITPKEYRCQCANYSVESGFMNMTEVLFSISQNSLLISENTSTALTLFLDYEM